MNLTSLVRPHFLKRIGAITYTTMHARDTQRSQLGMLLKNARDTLVGERYGFVNINCYDDYRSHVPVSGYADIRPLVERMIAGEKNILWPGTTRRFAQSSGTSDGKSKYIPVTTDSLRRNHYQGGSDVVSTYLNLYPDSRMFDGKGFILGGSFANELTLPAGVKVGDLSANLIDAISPLVNLVRVPSKRIALMEDWRQKLPALVKASMRSDITNISGVPSWFLTVLKEVITAAGAATIHDVWPHLEVFFHGGISFKPYREQYAHITDRSRMRYIETYNASEGFFAVQSEIDDPSLLLLLDLGIFYEFIPTDEVDDKFPRALPAWEVKEGHTYAMIITSCNGLWRYALGDTVTVVSVNPLKIIISGRTKHYINAFGEELMVYNADAAIASTCRELDCAITNYTAAPVYAGDKSRGRHEWLIEFNREPDDIEAFADTLDRHLCHENSDYQAKRAGNLFLDRLSIVKGRPGVFDEWLASTGKLGGQRKVPRLNNDRRVIDSLLHLNNMK